MNLLVRAILGLRRRTTAGLGFALLVVASLVAVEILGRRSTSDLHDLLALTALMPVAALAVIRHKQSPLPGVAALADLGHRILDSAKTCTFQLGLDFRGDPPVKRGIPPLIRWSIVGMAALTVILWLVSSHAPHNVRTAIMTVSYVGYLVLLVGLWLSLAFAIMLVAFVSVAVIHDSLIHRHRGTGIRARRGVGVALMIWFGLLTLTGALVPLRFAPAVCLTLAAVYLLGAMPARRFVVQFLWRPHDSIQVRSMPWARWVTCQFMLIGFGVLALIYASCGAVIAGDETAHAVMPLTVLLGAFLAWLGPGLLALLCVLTVVSRQRDPSRHARPVAHVTLHPGAPSRSEVKRSFIRRGWKVRFAPSPSQRLDVRVEVAAAALPLDRTPDIWPCIITRPDLDRDGLFVRLARRDEIQKRRRFLSGLETLMKYARSGSHSGSGYWLSPQYWFVPGLMRDSRPGEDDSDTELGESPLLTSCVGPPYYRMFPRQVRKHMYDVLRGTQVDLIFFEDGLGFKKLRRALRVLFEVFDVHAGRRPAEEVDFRGLPGLRVIIHDYQFDEPFKAENYPEPKYEMLGRARILHVFRDRGGDKELIEPPFDYDRRPAPVAVC
jgi:hypothetical protein